MRFADYLAEQEISDADFARRLNVTRETVRRYRMGTRMPDREMMAKITAETGNAVTANDFFAAETPAPPKEEARV